ncbi:MAG: right-handed parallel beta-helix repeat-containing protein, partial [Planctomycetota bacterium]
MRNLRFILISGCICLLCAGSSGARTITVDDDAPADFAAIQAAINDANNGDTVIIQPGTYKGDGNRDIDFLGKAITIRSTDPNDATIVATTIIDCNGTEEDPHRGFNFISDEEPTSVLSGLTIKNGYAPNQPEDYDRSVGGAIYIRSSPTIFRCVISANYAGYSGGGILVHGDSRARIAYCRITQNSAAGLGGGGIMSRFDQDVAIDHCMIDRNYGGGYGGGIYCGDARITHCTIADNSAGMRRGGINVSSAAGIGHCIVWGNSAPLSPDIGGSMSASYSYCNIGIDSPPNLGNISTDPCFVDQAAGDYHLSAGSPCIHAGDESFTGPGQVDFDGEPRVLLGRIDIGADEFSGDGPYVYISPRYLVFEASEGGENPASQELSITNIGNVNLNWKVSPTCSWLHANPSNGDSSGETDTILLTVDISGLPAGLHNCELIAGDPCALNVSQSAIVALNIDDGDGILYVPSQYPTIQAAIDWAESGDTVIIAPGIYTGEGNRDIDFLGKAITVRSTAPSDSSVVGATVIDCEGLPDDLHRGFIFKNGEDANSIVSGLAIKGGYADYGGAIYCEGSAGPSIKYCTIAGNTAREGGGIYIVGENLSAVIENCTIVGNRAIPNPTYWWWYPTGSGGGICLEARSYSEKSGPGAPDSMDARSDKEKRGGWYGEVTSFCTIANCTFTENIADYLGGGICGKYAFEVTVTNSIVWGNAAPRDNDVGMPSVADAPSPNYIISYSNIKDGLDGIGYYYFVEWGEGNIDAHPCFADPGRWDPNGTFDDVNDDIWVHGDYHLMSEAWRWDMARGAWTWDEVTSRCIDA